MAFLSAFFIPKYSVSLFNKPAFSLFNFIKTEGLQNQLSSLVAKSPKSKKQLDTKEQRSSSSPLSTQSSSAGSQQHNEDDDSSLLFDPNSNRAHYPVLVDKVTLLLKNEFFPFPHSDSTKCLVDCTLGSGGHAKHFLKHFQHLFVLGLDMDPRMLQYVESKVKGELDEEQRLRFKTLHKNFKSIDQINLHKVFEDEFPAYKNFHAIFADLGYNTLHLDHPEWGFSYLKNGPLDMRYDSSSPNTAADILNKGSYLQLFEILRLFGEDPNADVLSQMIIKHRQQTPFVNTKDLVNLILEDQSGYSFKGGQYRTITRVFQALRIATNQELGNLEELMEKMFEKLQKDGLGIIITFHSLEEKIVENKIRQMKRLKKASVVLMGERPDSSELDKNPKSRSAKLYAFKKSVK